jgi:FixJ family two-component response regulator
VDLEGKHSFPSELRGRFDDDPDIVRPPVPYRGGGSRDGVRPDSKVFTASFGPGLQSGSGEDMGEEGCAMSDASILLVDDEVSFVETFAKRLGSRGFSVVTAFSGPDALKVMDEKGPSKIDVVILDVKMPGMDGLEALAQMKARHPTIEVIMLTGHATVESAIEGMKRGAYDFMMKPAEIELVVAKIEAAAGKKRQHEVKILEAQAHMIVLRRGD